MENGYVGVRIPKSTLFNPSLPDYVPAPVRCVVYKDGALSSDLPNYLVSTTPAQTMTTTILTETVDECIIQVSYTFDKPELISNAGAPLEPAGPGYYRVTFRMIKGEKACIVTEESDFEINYELKVSNGLSPDKGRYQGHHASSIQNGYDINGAKYDKGNLTGWNATVDLQFDERKDFGLLARWNPFIVDSGWHWQLYNSAAPATANTFGIFDGRPSKLLGTLVSGAGIFTDAEGLDDMHGACEDNVCHYAWVSENKLFYKKIEANGSSTAEVEIATDLIRPFVFIQGNTVNVLAIDPFAAAGSQVKLLKKIGTDPFQAYTLTFDGTLEDPFVYGASTGTYDFILFEGTRTPAMGDPQTGLLLYAADFNTTTFTYQDNISSASIWRAANRPDVRKKGDGSILVTYGAGGNYPSFDRIAPNTTQFEHVPQAPPGPVLFSSGIDPSTGDFFHTASDGKITYVDLAGSTVLATYDSSMNIGMNNFVQHLPNRRSIATDATGNALVSSDWNFYWFNAANHKWSKLDSPAWQNIYPVHIHYNSVIDSFFIVGKYQGKLTRFRSKGGGNPVIAEVFNSTHIPAAGVRVTHSRLASPYYYPDIRFEWCIFAGTKGGDLPAADVVQPIGLAMNRLSGLANKVDGYQNDPLTFNTTFDQGAIYKSASGVAALIQELKTNEPFYQELIHIDPAFKDVMDAWRDDVGNPVKTNQVYQEIVAYSEGLKAGLTSGDGIYSYIHHYTLGSNDMQRYAAKISGLLADDKLTTAQRNTLHGIAALFARILWDDDFVPFFPEHGLSFGTGSQGATYAVRRWFFALAASSSAEFSARAALVPGYLQGGFDGYINEFGAAKGTPHYLQPLMDQFILTALQLKNTGIIDKFQTSDTLKYLSDFLLHLQTPKSVRFSNQRKLISLGDGSEESAALFGLLGTGFAGVDPFLSKKLMYAYRHGPAKGSDFGFVTLAVDQALPDTNLINIGTGHFPGYLSTMRSGLGTANESALWFINGEWYSDHRNDDRGEVAIYALGAPLALNYGSIYTPHMPSTHQKNGLVPESMFGQWNNPSWQPYTLSDDVWKNSVHEAYQAFKNSAYSKVTVSKNSDTWTRKVFQFNPRVQTPIFVIKDDLNNSNNYIWNFNFTARDVVGTPGGPVDPPKAFWNKDGSPQENPAASPVIALATGLNRFDFTGINWIAHPAGGIDWEVYIKTEEPGGATLSELAHNFIPAEEKDEFLATNNVSAFEERQTILRVKGKNSFFTVIVPYNKGQRPTSLAVTETGGVLSVTAPGVFDFSTDLTYYTYDETGGKKVLTTYDNQVLAFANATIEGGPMELEIRTDTIFARLHGATGNRTVTLPPGNWTLNRLSENASFSNGQWTLGHTSTGSLHNSYGGGYTEYIFVTAVKVSPKIFLQGPYNSGTSLMNDQLRSGGLIPLTEPYTGLGFTQLGSGGGEKTWQSILDVTGNDAIVDWVFVELRDKNSPSTKVATRCTLLQRDGDVVDIDGVSPVDFHGVAADDYFVVVRHRNHLGVCTAAAVSLSENTAAVDFTDAATGTWGVNAQKDLGGGKSGMWAGDVNQDGKVRYNGSNNDKVNILLAVGLSTPNNVLTGYYTTDVNMDSKARYNGSNNDKIQVLLNIGLSTPNNIIFQQIP